MDTHSQMAVEQMRWKSTFMDGQQKYGAFNLTCPGIQLQIKNLVGAVICKMYLFSLYFVICMIHVFIT